MATFLQENPIHARAHPLPRPYQVLAYKSQLETRLAHRLGLEPYAAMALLNGANENVAQAIRLGRRYRRIS